MSDFEYALEDAINYWKTNIEDEWYFDTFRKKYLTDMNSPDAYDNINLVATYLLKENEVSTAIEILQTIIDLSNKSNTTQIPKNILLFKDVMKNKFADRYYQNKVSELFKFYRIA